MLTIKQQLTDYDWGTEEEGDSEGELDGSDCESEDEWSAHPPQHWNLEDPRVTVGSGPPRLNSGEQVHGSNKRQL
jgi:hypothetical protein